MLALEVFSIQYPFYNYNESTYKINGDVKWPQKRKKGIDKNNPVGYTTK